MIRRIAGWSAAARRGIVVQSSGRRRRRWPAAALIGVAVLAALSGPVHAMPMSDAPVVHLISPSEVVETTLPQPTLKVYGEHLRQPGVFGSAGNPTISISHTELQDVRFSAVASTNFAGTEASVSQGINHFNMLQMPVGVYDLTVTRPDGSSTSVAGGFSLIEEPELNLEPGEVRMTIASYWGGPVTGADVHGDYAYIANGRRLVIVDVSEVGAPVEVSSMSKEFAWTWPVRDVKAHGDFVYVLSGGNGVRHLSVVNVSNVASPKLMWVSAKTHNTNDRVCLAGEFAYLVGGNSAWKFDISDPLNPINLGATTESCDPGPMSMINGWHSPDHLQHMEMVGNHLFVSDRNGGFTILDVANPDEPLANSIVGVYTAEATVPGLPIENFGFAVEGSYAYLNAGSHGLQILDIFDLSQPALVGHLPLPQLPGAPPPDAARSGFRALAVRNGFAHLSYRYTFGSQSFALFVTVDVTEPHDLSLVHMMLLPAPFAFTKIVLDGEADIAYMAGADESISAAREHYMGSIASDSPTLLAEVLPHGGTTDIAWSNGIVVNTRTQTLDQLPTGLFIRDVSDPANPVLLSNIDNVHHLGVDVQNNRVYTTHYASSMNEMTTLSLYGIGDPAEPALLDAIAIGLMNQAGTNYVLAAEPNVFVANAGVSANLPFGLTVLNVHGIEPNGGIADLNGDDVVDVTDLLILLSAWGGCPAAGTGECAADLNGDGMVDVSDLLILLNNWG